MLAAHLRVDPGEMLLLGAACSPSSVKSKGFVCHWPRVPVLGSWLEPELFGVSMVEWYPMVISFGATSRVLLWYIF